MTEKEQIERMLLPRFEAIADYPHSPYKVGQIIDGEEGILIGTYYYDYEAGTETFEEGGNLFSQYPHLFREIPWHSWLILEALPVYVRNNNNGIVQKVELWAYDHGRASFKNAEGELWYVDEVTPATEAEYEKGRGK